MTYFRFAAPVFLACLALPAMGDVLGQSTKTTPCFCTDRTGAQIELGQTICMQVDGRMFMAQCQMSLNVPMWREVAEGCLSSSLPQSVDPGIHAGSVDS